jgi:hypothetical protein
MNYILEEVSKIHNIHRLEKAIIEILNFDGWDLEWSGGGFEHYDAVGFTPKNIPCVIEMKFRKQYYYEKLLEKHKYDDLIYMPYDMAKFYFIADPKGNYLFWLNNLEMPEPVEILCPDTTFWEKKKVLKECYLLPENDAVVINKNVDL